MLAWTEQVKCRGLSEQPNYNRVATKPCNMKLVIGITLISVNHYSSTALERSVINITGGLKPVLHGHNLTLSKRRFYVNQCYGDSVYKLRNL